MKRLVIITLILFSFSFMVFGELTPPSFSNQQFHGTVTWDANLSPAPINVIARTSLGDKASSIVPLPCLTGDTCRGTYGKNIDNILRIQAPGEQVTFIIQGQAILSVPYEADKVTEVNLDMTSASVIIENVDVNQTLNQTLSQTFNQTLNQTLNQTSNLSTNQSCSEAWVCGNWSGCVAGQDIRLCIDTNACNATKLERNITRVCTVTSLQQDTKTASVPKAQAPAVKPKIEQPSKQFPAIQNPSVPASCDDGIKNQNEDDVDCGGECDECSGSRILVYVIPALVLVLLGGIIFFIVEKMPKVSPQQMQQLNNYFRASMQRGYSKEQIEENLIKSGWNKRVINKFIKKSNL
jgi:hypothetical protein